MKNFRVAIVQCMASSSIDKNTETAKNYMREAKAQGADMVLFPECFLTSYTFPEVCRELRPVEEIENQPDFLRWNRRAITEDEEHFQEIQACARELGIGVVITAFSKGVRLPRNTAWILDRDGEVLLKYVKVHTCDFSMERYLECGTAFPTCDFEGVKLGVMICYDREYPESARELMLGGAEVILHPNDCSLMFPRLRELSVRAMENMVYVAMANPPCEDAGCSCAYSPFVFADDGPDNTMFVGEETETALYCVDFDMDRLQTYRAEEDLGKFRKPQAYCRLR